MSSSSEHRLVSHPHQSLARHLASVEEASGRALAAKVLDPDFLPDADFLRRLLVYFHDFGKATDYFQWRITEVARKEKRYTEEMDEAYIMGFAKHPDRGVLEAAKDDHQLRGHSLIGAFVVQSALPETAPPLLRAIVYEAIARHHGNLKNFEEGTERGADTHAYTLDQQWPRIDHADYRLILAETGLTYTDDFGALRAAYAESFFRRVYVRLSRNTSLQPYLQTVFLFSLLLAGDKGDMMLQDRSRIGRGRRMPGELIEQYKSTEFRDTPPSQMNDWREEAYQRVAGNLRENPDAGFYAITLPTGMGKTLTAYNAAVLLQNLLADRWQVDNPNCTPKIIYCLPFTSVIDQNAAILEDILRCFPDTELSGELAKHHYLADWPEQKGDDENKLEYSEKEYLVEGWEYTLTVTTFVQLLETIFSNRNRKLRKFHNLANAVVILDEVQSIPPKYFRVVSKMFAALHAKLGTRFVLVTATQPFLMRDEDLARPLVELTDPTLAYTRRAFERMDRIDLDLTLWLNGPEDLTEQIDHFRRIVREESNRSFLFILNLVAESQAVFAALKEEDLDGVEYIYLSSAILPIERKRRIARIQDRNHGLRKVVVSTQVVEAGVDIDLDVVYRAMAPLDSINQSAGRCNRSMRAGFRGSVRLFQSSKATKIYDSTLLTKTRKVLKEQLRLAEQRPDYRPGILPEACFYAMNEYYAAEVKKAVADTARASDEILNNLYRLQFEEVEKQFKLIDKTYTTYGIYIDDPGRLPPVKHKLGEVEEEMTSTEVYREMLRILRDDALGRWEKKQALRLLRPALLQYVVQFPEKALPEDLKREALDKPFLRLGTEPGQYEYTQYYDLETGYKTLAEKPTGCY